MLPTSSQKGLSRVGHERPLNTNSCADQPTKELASCTHPGGLPCSAPCITGTLFYAQASKRPVTAGSMSHHLRSADAPMAAKSESKPIAQAQRMTKRGRRGALIIRGFTCQLRCTAVGRGRGPRGSADQQQGSSYSEIMHSASHGGRKGSELRCEVSFHAESTGEGSPGIDGVRPGT